jgi:hypothetical protein
VTQTVETHSSSYRFFPTTTKTKEEEEGEEEEAAAATAATATAAAAQNVWRAFCSPGMTSHKHTLP